MMSSHPRFPLPSNKGFHALFCSSGRSSVTSMVLTQLAHTMATVTCSWTGSMSTTTKPQVEQSNVKMK